MHIILNHIFIFARNVHVRSKLPNTSILKCQSSILFYSSNKWRWSNNNKTPCNLVPTSSILIQNLLNYDLRAIEYFFINKFFSLKSILFGSIMVNILIRFWIYFWFPKLKRIQTNSGCKGQSRHSFHIGEWTHNKHLLNKLNFS